MQADRARSQLPRLDQQVRNAAQLCQNSAAPEALRSCLAQLEREVALAAALLDGQDERRIAACIYRLEELSDLALRNCGQPGDIDEDVRRAVEAAHSALADLKRQLH